MIHFYLVLALLLHVALSHVVTDVNKDYIVVGGGFLKHGFRSFSFPDTAHN